MVSETDNQEIARFYTKSRRFPKLIGRFRDGTKLPGGPYTVAQLGFAVAIFVVAIMTKNQWGTGSILLDGPLAAAAAAGGGWLAGRIPPTRRNLVYVIAGGIGAILRPAGGRYLDRTLSFRPPHGVTSRTDILDVGEIIASPISAAPPPPMRPVVEVVPATPIPTQVAQAPAITGVQRLLQQTQSK